MKVNEVLKGSMGMKAIGRCVEIPLSILFPRVVHDFDYLTVHEVADQAAATAPPDDLDLNILSAEARKVCMRVTSVDDVLVSAALFLSEEENESLKDFQGLARPRSTEPLYRMMLRSDSLRRVAAGMKQSS